MWYHSGGNGGVTMVPRGDVTGVVSGGQRSHNSIVTGVVSGDQSRCHHHGQGWCYMGCVTVVTSSSLTVVEICGIAEVSRHSVTVVHRGGVTVVSTGGVTVVAMGGVTMLPRGSVTAVGSGGHRWCHCCFNMRYHRSGNVW